MKDLYRILEVSHSASQEEIKKAYRALSKKHHPDSNPDNREAEEHFKEVSEAYAILQDPDKRQKFDKIFSGSSDCQAPEEIKRAGKSGSKSFENIDFSSMEELFAQFFGFRPKDGGTDEEIIKKEKKTRPNPIDMTEMFERYMGIKK